MTDAKTIPAKPKWFHPVKYLKKSELTPLEWYGELSIRQSYLEIVKADRKALDNYEPFERLRENAFATIGIDPIISESQLISMLNKDVWSEANYKSHSARLTTCLDIFNLKIRKDIRKTYLAKIPIEDPDTGEIIGVTENSEHIEGYHLHNTPVDLQDSDISSLHKVHLTINLNAPNAILKEDIWKIIETLKEDYGQAPDTIASNVKKWASSNVLEHIDLHIAEIQQGRKFKAFDRAIWISPSSRSADITKASTNEKKKALSMLDQGILDQLYFEVYSADHKKNVDRN